MQNKGDYIILLGGVGGDSHSVGLTILRQALLESGYKVRYCGTQNRLENFFQLAPLCNVVMISSMDGHTKYYLAKFPELMKQYKAYRPLWYLGGNLHIGNGIGYDSQFMEMGFNRVFVKFVDIKTVLATLEKDLSSVEPAADCPLLWERSQPTNIHIPAAVSEDRLDLGTFERARREVLDGWKTGIRAKRLDENAEFLACQPSFPKIQALVNSGGLPILIQPRSGVTLLDNQIKLFRAFKRAGARVLSYQVDSLTRNNDYVGAEEVIRESRVSGVSTLNGFPLINHGVDGLRRVILKSESPSRLDTVRATRACWRKYLTQAG